MNVILSFFKKKKYHFLSIVLVFFLCQNRVNAQCTGCTSSPPTSGNFTAFAGETYCFNSNANLSDVILRNGSTICVAAGVSLIINNNVQTQSTDSVTMIVDGLLQFNQVLTVNARLGLTVNSTGEFRVGNTGSNNLSFNGTKVKVSIDGIMNSGVINFQNASADNLVEISPTGKMNILGNINVSGETSFRNQGELFISASYNNNSTSIFVNCGLMTSTSGFNIGGGTVDNTGRFFVPSGSVDFGGSTGEFYNKGYAEISSTLNINSPSHLFYNEGLLRSFRIQGDGTLEGPATGLGYIEVGNRPNFNSNTIGPNLDFTYYNGTTDNGDGRPTTRPGAGQNGTNVNSNRQWVFGNFNGSYVSVNTISFSCRTAGGCASPVDTIGSPCPNVDGTLPVDLPVELLYFTAKLEGKNVGKLNWATANELNNAGYEIEHALPTNEVPVFNQIDYMNGAGSTTTQQLYTYQSPNLVPGIHYFRLKQVDFDGTYAYSKIRALRVDGLLVQKLFPTVLSEGSNTVYIQVEKNDTYKIELISTLGQIVKSYTKNLEQDTYHELVLDVNAYPSGIYIVSISNGTDSFTEKICVK